MKLQTKIGFYFPSLIKHKVGLTDLRIIAFSKKIETVILVVSLFTVWWALRKEPHLRANEPFMLVHASFTLLSIVSQLFYHLSVGSLTSYYILVSTRFVLKMIMAYVMIVVIKKYYEKFQSSNNHDVIKYVTFTPKERIQHEKNLEA